MSVVMVIDDPHGSHEIYQRAASRKSLLFGGSVHVARPPGSPPPTKPWPVHGRGTGVPA